MPCDDISERVDLMLDVDDRVVAFSLQKATCGASVDAALIHVVAGLPIERVAALSAADLSRDEGLSGLLLEKQLAALQAAIAVYLGRASGDKNSPFRIETIELDGKGTRLRGRLRLDLPIESIPACRSCVGRACDGIDVIDQAGDG